MPVVWPAATPGGGVVFHQKLPADADQRQMLASSAFFYLQHHKKKAHAYDPLRKQRLQAGPAWTRVRLCLNKKKQRWDGADDNAWLSLVQYQQPLRLVSRTVDPSETTLTEPAPLHLLERLLQNPRDEMEQKQDRCSAYFFHSFPSKTK